MTRTLCPDTSDGLSAQAAADTLSLIESVRPLSVRRENRKNPMRIQGISMKKHTERGDELPGEVTAEWRGKQYPAVLNEYGVAIITGPAIEEAAPMILLDEVTQ